MALNYKGSSPTDDASDPNLGLIVMDTNNCQRLLDALPINQASANNLIQSGWSDGSGTFAGLSNYLTQNSLNTILAGTSNNPCVISSAVATAVANFVTQAQVGLTGAGGVASLDGNRKVPLSQLPSMGGGYLIGPYGCSSLMTVSATGSLPGGAFKLVEWAIGNPGGKNFQPLVFMQVNATTSTNLGRTVIEVRMSNGPATSYSYLNPLVATGTGRTFYTGYQTISVLPCGSSAGQSNSYYTVGASTGSYTNLYLTAWVYDAGTSYISTTSINSTDVVLATAFLMQSTS